MKLGIVCGALLAACQSSTPSPPPASCKPEAPLTVEIATRALAGDELEVTARVTPTRDVDAVELVLALPAHATALAATSSRFGVTAAGTAHALTTRIRVDHRTSELTAIARTPVDGIVMARTSSVAIGAPAPTPRTRTYALPDGELAREVQP